MSVEATLSSLSTPLALAEYIWEAPPELLGPEAYEIDFIAVERAQAFLGISWPLLIDFSPRAGDEHAYASYHLERSEMPALSQDHQIWLASNLHPTFASMCLWHELRHSAQAEAHASPWAWSESLEELGDYYKISADPSPFRYASLWFEAEALETSHFHFTKYSLVQELSI